MSWPRLCGSERPRECHFLCGLFLRTNFVGILSKQANCVLAMYALKQGWSSDLRCSLPNLIDLVMSLYAQGPSAPIAILLGDTKGVKDLIFVLTLHSLQRTPSFLINPYRLSEKLGAERLIGNEQNVYQKHSVILPSLDFIYFIIVNTFRHPLTLRTLQQAFRLPAS